MCTGPSAESSFDSYLDQRNPLCGVTAINALHWNSTSAEVILPNILSVGPGDIRSICLLVNHMFPSITVPEFKAGGSLCSVFLEACAVSLIWGHPEMSKGCKTHNHVSSMLISVANKAQIHHSSKPSLSPPAVLLEWSQQIGDDVKM